MSSPKVSPSPAAAMMQAPCSLVALVWGAMRRDGAAATLLLGTDDPAVADRLTHALFAIATAVFWLTLRAVWLRRHAIRWNDGRRGGDDERVFTDRHVNRGGRACFNGHAAFRRECQTRLGDDGLKSERQQALRGRGVGHDSDLEGTAR